ncbi:MAG: hypothetical protein COB53_09925 [Elusimicrobia bacterium]|nr:MAG: hypothetical protein COB53_09925 [Elusimicrobiota bacterium]
MVDFSKQQFVLARLADYCEMGPHSSSVSDPVLYMWQKLKESEKPLQDLKNGILEDNASSYFWKIKRNTLTEEDTADFKQLLNVYLSPGDFVDAMYQLFELFSDITNEDRFKTAVVFFKNIRSYRLLDEEDKTGDHQNKEWKRLVTDIMRRLRFDLLEKIVKHKPMNARRLRFILRRLRMETAEYCTVLHFPKHENDTLTPFIVPRVEALIAGNQRVLKLIRVAG